MKKILSSILFAGALLIAGEAFALDLAQARAQGLVGETLEGYIAPVTSSSEANALVSEVNERRREEYQKISKANGQPVAVVGKVAAERIISGLPSGSYYRGPSGAWMKK